MRGRVSAVLTVSKRHWSDLSIRDTGLGRGPGTESRNRSQTPLSHGVLDEFDCRLAGEPVRLDSVSSLKKNSRDFAIE